MRHFKQLTYTDRLNIEKWLKEGMKKGEIAEKLRVHRNTITNELKRGFYEHLNSDWTTEIRYSPDIAETRYQENLRAKGAGYKIGNDIAFAQFLEGKILGLQTNGKKDKRRRFSPAAALAAAEAAGFETKICKSTLYSYIDKGDVFLELTNKDLMVKGNRKQRHRRVRPKRPPAGTSIEKRPEYINKRTETGHWEMDSVLGKRGTNKCLVTLTERITLKEMAFVVEDHSAACVENVINNLEQMLGIDLFKNIFKTITVDNGSEFANCAELEKSCTDDSQRTKLYYCHPYSSWERGRNENQNKMLRRFFPKGFDFSNTTQEDVQRACDWINAYPRKTLNWNNADALFNTFIAQIS